MNTTTTLREIAAELGVEAWQLAEFDTTLTTEQARENAPIAAEDAAALIEAWTTYTVEEA